VQCVEDDNSVIATWSVAPAPVRQPPAHPEREYRRSKELTFAVSFRSVLGAHHANTRRGFAKLSQ